MITPSAIALADGETLTSSFAVDEFLMTVQVDYIGVNGDFKVVPLQLLSGSSWTPFLDFQGETVEWVVKHPKKSGIASGSRVFQIPDGIHAVTCKVSVSPVSGKLGASLGSVQLYIKNTEAEV